MQKNNIFWILGVLMVPVIFGGMFFYVYWQLKNPISAQDKSQRQILIGLSMGNLKEERWQKYKDEFLKKAAELGVKVDLQVASNSTEKQISQIEVMIIKKVDVLVIVSNDKSALNGVMAKAQKSGIEVIFYDHENEMSKWWEMMGGAKNNFSVTHI